MIFSSFGIEPENPEALKGICNLSLTFKISTKEKIHAFGFFVGDTLVGDLVDNAGLEPGTHDVQCDLSRLGDGPSLLFVKAYRFPDNTPVFESEAITILVTKAGVAKPEPEHFWLRLTNPSADGRAKPEISGSIVDMNGIPLANEVWHVTATVDGQPAKGATVKGADVRFVPIDPLREGMRRIEFTVLSANRPDHETHNAMLVRVDLTPPLVEVDTSSQITNVKTPQLNIRVRDLGSGIDPESLLINVDGTPLPMVIETVDRHEMQPVPVAPLTPSSTVWDSTLTTLAELKEKVSQLQVSSEPIRDLNRALDNVQQALIGGYNGAARERLGSFLLMAVRRSHLSIVDSDHIEPAQVNNLVCGAVNILSGIPLPNGSLSTFPASFQTVTISDLKNVVSGFTASRSTKGELNKALDNVQQALDGQIYILARERIVLFIQQVIRSSNLQKSKAGYIILADASHLIADAANIFIGLPLPVSSANRDQVTDLAVKVMGLRTSLSTKTTLRNALESIAKFFNTAKFGDARRMAGILIGRIVDHSSYASPSTNSILREEANELIDSAVKLFVELPSEVREISQATHSSMVMTISELRNELNTWASEKATIKVLQAILTEADLPRTQPAGDVNSARILLGRFIRQVTAQCSLPADNTEWISADEANSLVCGAANILTGKDLWRRYAVRPATRLLDGEHRFSVSVVDLAGNRSDEVHQMILIDTTPPQVVKIFPELNAVVGTRKLQIIADLNDEAIPETLPRGKPSGIASFKLILDGLDITNESVLKENQVTYNPADFLNDGQHAFEMTIVDRAGNQSLLNSSFYVDATPPTISEIKPPSNLRTNANSILISARLSDNKTGVDVKSVRLYIHGRNVTRRSNLTPDGVSYWYTPRKEGRRKVRILCADLAGNPVPPLNYEFFVDWTPSRVAIDPSLDELAIVADEVNVYGILSEPGTIKVNGKSANVKKDLTFNVNVPLMPGHNQLIATATDLAGNQTISSSVDVYRITELSSAVTGVILDIKGAPLAGVSITEPQTGISGVSNELGRFALVNLPARDLLLYVNPGPASARGYKPFQVQVLPEYGRVTEFRTPIYMLKSALDQGTEISDSGDSTAIQALNEPELTLTVQNDQILFPTGAARKISIYSVPSDHLPVDIPEFLPAGPVAVLEPSGLQIPGNGGARITLPNSLGMESGTTMPLIAFNSETGKWELGGFGKVSDDEKRIESLDGMGIRHFSFVAPAPLGPMIDILQEDKHTPGADALKGGLETSIQLPGFRSFDQQFTPELVYSSLTAAPSVVITGVFKGMKEFANPPEFIVDDPLPTEMTGSRFVAVDTYKFWRESKWYEFWEDDKVYLESQTTTSPEIYLPAGAASPFGSIGSHYWKDEVWVEASRQLIQQPLTFYKFQIKTEVKKQSAVWPESITSRYLFSNMDTGEFILQGSLQKKGPEPRPGEPDTREEFPTLPENLAISYYLEPRLNDDNYYPTGLYSFLARYVVKAKGYESAQYKRVATQAFVDDGFLDNIRRHGTPEAYQAMVDVRKLYQSGPELRTQYAFSDPLDYLFHDDAGTLIVHNLTQSPLGRGWRLKETQEVHPLGHSQVLVIGPEGKHIYTASQTIQSLQSGTSFGYIALSADRQRLVGTSLNSVGKSGGTVSGLGDSLALDPVFRTDNYVNEQRQWKTKPVNRIAYDWMIVSRHQIFTCRKWYDCGWFTVEDWGWGNPHEVFDHMESWWSDWSQVGSGETKVSVDPQIAGIVISAEDTVYVSDSATHRIFRISPGSQPVALAGRLRPASVQPDDYTSDSAGRTVHSWSGEEVNPGLTPDQTPFANCQLHTPGGLALDDEGNLIFAETGTNRIRKLNFTSGLLETFAGTGNAQYDYSNIRADQANLPSPTALARNASGDLYVLLNLSDGIHQVIGRIDRSGYYEHIVGSPTGTINPGVDARLYKLVGASHIAVDAQGTLFVSVPAQNIVLTVTPQGFVDQFAGNGDESPITGEDGPALQASLIQPQGIAITPEGNVLIADSGHKTVRLVTQAIGNLGYTEFRNPAGYFESRLRREADGTWTRRYKDGKVVQFDQQGRHTATVDRNGNTIAYQYDGQGQLMHIDYPGNCFLSLQYSSGGQLQEVSDHIGRTTQLGTQGSDLTSVELPDGTRQRFHYDEAGRMVAHIDASSVPTEYTYNDYGRLVTQSRAGQTIKIERADDATAGNSAEGSTPQIVESTDTRLVAPDQTGTKYAVENGLLTQATSTNGETMKITYGLHGLPAEVLRPNNKKVIIIYNENGDVVEQYDEAFETTEKYEYDNKGRKTNHVDAVGRVTRWKYDAVGNLVEMHAGKNSVVSSYEYDVQGLVTRKLEGGVTANFEYDERGNLSRERRGLWDIRYELDAAGNTTAKTEGNTRRTGYAYDPLNRLVEVDEALGKTTYKYDLTGNLIQAIDPTGSVTAFEYDSRRNITKKIDPAGRTWEYQYNTSDQKILEIDPDGTQIQSTYNNQLRTQKTIVNGKTIEQAQCPEGTLLWARDDQVELINHFDATGQHAAQEFRLPGGAPVTLRYQLDPSGKKIGVACRKQTTNYSYDETGSLIGVQAGDFGIQFERDGGGRIHRIVRTNGITGNLNFDEAGHVSEIIESGSTSELTRRTILFDSAGDCVEITNDDSAWRFEYDNMGQLAKASLEQDDLLLEYSYDSKGNRLSGPEGDFRYDEHGILLLEDGNWSYRYDAIGNLIEKDSKTNPQERHFFNYSPFGQLVKYRREDGATVPVVTAEYIYDPTGRRIGKQVEYRDHPEKNQTLWWIYDGDNIFLELDSEFNVLRQYITSQDIDTVLGFLEGDKAYYFVRGHLGSIEQVLDQDGEVVARYEYDPFGNLLLEEGALENRYRFTGREWDEESGTYYYRARQYDPQTGRFLQPDPREGDPKDALSIINRYVYCRNSPLRYVDPYGRNFWDDLWGGIKSVVGFIVGAISIVVGALVFLYGAIVSAWFGIIAGIGYGLYQGFKNLFNDRNFFEGFEAGFSGGWAIGTIPGRYIMAAGLGLVFGGVNLMQGKSFVEGFKEGWRTGLSLFPALKWRYREASRRLVGKVHHNYLNDGKGTDDTDENVQITPSVSNPSSFGMLKNRFGDGNYDPWVECEIALLNHRTYHDNEIRGFKLYQNDVVAQGVLIDDDGHDSKVELHPLDILVAKLHDGQYPQWTKDIEQDLINRLGQGAISVYRLLAGSDYSPYLRPPLTSESRWVETYLDNLPEQPALPGTWILKEKNIVTVQEAASWSTRLDPGALRLYINVLTKSFNQGGPGVLFADIVVYWDQ